jgi:hypothetical protein
MQGYEIIGQWEPKVVVCANQGWNHKWNGGQRFIGCNSVTWQSIEASNILMKDVLWLVTSDLVAN